MKTTLNLWTIRLVLVLLLAMTASCDNRDSADRKSGTPGKTESKAFNAPETTYLGQQAATIAAGHGGDSGFLLLDRGWEALSWRTVLIDAAQKSVDAQYFLWKDDKAGKVMMQRLMAAADRGVRVRVLIDDSMTKSDPEYLALFGAYPNIELRLYKPFGPRHKSLVIRGLDYVTHMRVLNRRMHNKLFIVDDSVTIIGGRNIGSEYFEYPGPFVFRSRDLLAFGPVVAKSGTYFDEYWNSDWTIPIKDVVSTVPTLAETKAKKMQLDQFTLDPANYPPGFHDKFKAIKTEMIKLGGELLWGKAKILVDTVPDKDGKPQSRAEIDNTGVTLGRLTDGSSEEVLIQSAYLILLDKGFEGIERATARGVNVKLSTNSMAANNHLTAFVGYQKQRRQLLATGAELYEIRPDMKSESALFTQAQLQEHKTIFGLHAKTMVFDRKVTFVGSFNLDPRSVNLNTEMGLLVESKTLAKAVAESIENDIAAGNSWQVITKNESTVEWITEKNGVITSELETEPMTSAARRVEADALKVIPDNAQL